MSPAFDRVHGRFLAEMRIDCDAHGRPVAVLVLHGELTADTAPGFTQLLDRLSAAGTRRVLVDLGNLSMCTSHGFSVFDTFQRRLSREDGYVRLTNPRGPVARSLAVLERSDVSFLPEIV